MSNDQSNACVAGTTRFVNASCSDIITVPLFFSPPPPRAIIPDARPLGAFEIKMPAINGKTLSYLNDLTKKIGDCEQSSGLSMENSLLPQLRCRSMMALNKNLEHKKELITFNIFKYRYCANQSRDISHDHFTKSRKLLTNRWLV